jgi:hypothetical protein
MTNEKLIAFVQKWQSKGIPDDEIKKMALSRGWPENEVNGASAFLNLHTGDYLPLQDQTSKRQKQSLPTFIFVMIVLVLGATSWFFLYTKVFLPLVPAYANPVTVTEATAASK